MADKNLKKTTLLTSIVWLLLALMALGGAAFAWFTFGVTTNITPIASSIGRGGVDLKISDAYSGPFGAECTLVYENNAEESLYPVSTSTLDNWYEAIAQDRNGISTRFREITQQDTLDAMVFHGKVYLLAENQDCTVYLNRADMSFSMDNATDQAARLGLIFTNETTGQELNRLILRIDDMSMERSGESAESTQTVSQEGSVIEGIDGSGYPTFANDPAEDINQYMAYTVSQGDFTTGERQLAMLPANTVITVEYYLYLEGCDDNCVNSIQDGNVSFNFGFAGVGNETD
jgi:hypothetical protein